MLNWYKSITANVGLIQNWVQFVSMPSFCFLYDSCISLLNLNFLFVGILKIQNRCSITFITFQHITWSVPLYLEHDKFVFDIVLVNNTIHGIYVQSSVSLRILVLLITIFNTFSLWFNVIQQSSIEYPWTNCSLLKDSFHFISSKVLHLHLETFDFLLIYFNRIHIPADL